MKMKLLFLTLLYVASTNGYINKLDNDFVYECPTGKAISLINSYHNNKAEDRRWTIICGKKLPTSEGEKYWTFWVNDFDGEMNFKCPFNSVMTGMAGIHNNEAEDRRYKFQCNQLPGYVIKQCTSTGYLNNMDGIFNYHAREESSFITGMQSYHDNDKEDRRFALTVCKFVGKSQMPTKMM